MQNLLRHGFAIVLIAIAACARDARAQVIRGQVKDIESKQPIPGAAVVLRDSAQRTIGFARTDGLGSFYLRVSDSTYTMQVMRVGFAPESISTTAFAADTTNILFEMHPIAVRLSPAVIAEEKRGIREMRVMGLNLKSLATHIITPSEIAAASRGARTYLDEIRTALPAGVMVNERSQCVGTNRSRSLDAVAMCAMVFVDGVQVVTTESALDIVQPGWLDHAIYLDAADAGVRFGTGASGGVLLLFTKYGGYSFGRN